MVPSRTQVAIVGGGPAGMLLAHLLRAADIESVVLERRSKDHVLSRVRAGVLEQVTAETLRDAGLGARMDREAYLHDGVALSSDGESFRVDFLALTGRRVTVYGQTEVQKDLCDAHERSGGAVVYEAEDVDVSDVAGAAPAVTYRTHGQEHRLEAEFVAGCDGAHGVSRGLIPATVAHAYERVYPFGWLGVLSETPPVSDELIYCRHERGFALCSMRNPNLSRYYVQCPLDTSIDEWPDDRFWDELRRRIPAGGAERLVTGPSIEKSITPLRSLVIEPMGWGRIFLAGDAAHVVPPTGAKGLNLAVSDVVYLARALREHYEERSDAGLDTYSETALRRVWKAVRFSWWMTTTLHRFPDEGDFTARVQRAELDYLAGSEAARTAMAENYVGLPY
ncbi:MAG: 4-hydroxybenzoate 3-monooxygenase [Acidimicrobiales bacterium]